MQQYLILSEATLPRLLWRGLAGRPTCVIDTLSYGGMDTQLNRIAAALRARGRADILSDDHAEWISISDPLDLARLHDPFSRHESWMEPWFRFDRSDRAFGRYAASFRHAVCSAIYRRYLLSFLIEDVRVRAPGGAKALRGIDSLQAAIHGEQFGDVPPLRPDVGRSFVVGFNFLLAVAGAASVVGVALRQLRLRVRPREYFLGCDFVDDERDEILRREVADSEESTLIVPRDATMLAPARRMAGGRHIARREDGAFTPSGGAVATVEGLREVFALWRRAAGLPGEMFRSLIGQPRWRMIYRGFFNRFRCRFFWARDEYNTDHLVRTQELRRAGGKALGVMHGVSAINAVAHQLRHIDFDVFFIFGRHQYQRYYNRTWPAHMKIVIAGSFGMDRADLHKLRVPPLGDVMCILGKGFQTPWVMECYTALARAFPDRKFHVNVKQKQKQGAFGETLNAFMNSAPNLIEDNGRSYDLFFKCRYVVSMGSTLSIEAVQFNRPSFVFDPGPRLAYSHYREFEGICVHSAEEAIERIRAIESGDWAYPRAKLTDMIRLDGRIFWDLVREEMGLEAREGPLAHIALVAADRGDSILTEGHASAG